LRNFRSEVRPAEENSHPRNAAFSVSGCFR
jgi:hypothetical protein